jgi:hypothetical protein
MIQPQRCQLFVLDSLAERLRQRLKYCFIARSKANRDGFTMSEVIVAILLATTFTSVALQGMVVAMLLKSKALQLAEANQWVQTDLESIRASITLSRFPLAENQSKCHPESVDRGFAAAIGDNLAGSTMTSSTDRHLTPLTVTSRTGKTFQIVRRLTIPSTPENSQFKILGIEYLVIPMSGTNLEPPIFQSYTEVMPDAALQCQ